MWQILFCALTIFAAHSQLKFNHELDLGELDPAASLRHPNLLTVNP
jgi:hypothetical protein